MLFALVRRVPVGRIAGSVSVVGTGCIQYCIEKNIGGAFLRAFLMAFLAFLRLFSGFF